MEPAAGQTAGLTGEERGHLADFVAAQSFRTEAFYKGINPQIPREQFAPILAQLRRSSFLISIEIADRKWALMVIETAGVFYLGDNPVVLQRTEEPADGKNLGFDVAGVEVLLPLSPKCALYMPCTATSHDLISGYECALSINEQMSTAAVRGTSIPSAYFDAWRLARRVKRNTEALYKSLTQGIALAASQENIENLNYLQCAWSHAAVFSNHTDFAFAKRVY
ncbi:MAG: DUF4238 domain-containing protein, partial [Terriglobales bacterium]